MKKTQRSDNLKSDDSPITPFTRLLKSISSPCALYLCVSLFMGPLFFGCNAQDSEDKTDTFIHLREHMVTQHIKNRGIQDPRILKAMMAVERHKFVPEQIQSSAYGDFPLPIGEGQTISQPYIVALMTEVIKPHSSMKVLEIGTGSGYQAAVLAELCKSVYTIEIVESLGERSKKLLSDLGYDNVHVKIGDGFRGWEENAPFDAIVVTCAPSRVPQPLIDQLTDGGRMIIPVGEAGAQELVLMTKKDGELHEHAIIPVRFVPMVGSGGEMY